jgi:parvulin-like peptidyl-prolyl isomerase
LSSVAAQPLIATKYGHGSGRERACRVCAGSTVQLLLQAAVHALLPPHACLGGSRIQSNPLREPKMLLRTAQIAVVAMSLANIAFAQEPATAKPCVALDCPVAKRGTAVITVADVTAKVRSLEPKLQSALLSDPKQINKMLENMLILRQIANEIDPVDAQKDALLQARLKQAYDEVVAVYRLDQVRAERVTGDFETLARERYLTNMASMKTPKQLVVRHLLIESRTQGEAAALAKATDLAKQLQGADQQRFQDLVLETSDDPSKAQNAGLLNLSENTTEIDPDFLKGALALAKVGEISPPIYSQFGYHLIQLIEVTPARVVPFEEAKSAIITSLRDEARRRVVLEYRSDLSISGELEHYPQNLEALIVEDIPGLN